MYVCVSVLITIMAETILFLLITTNIEKNEMLDNGAFTVFAFLHIHDCSLSQEQYFKPFTTLTRQTKSLMRTCSASEIPSYKATTVCHR